MEESHPTRRSRRQHDYRNVIRADGVEEEEMGDGGDALASSERVNQPDEVIDITTDAQSNKPRPNNNGRTNKSRTVFTPEQLALLQDAFEKNPYPSREVREKLEEVTGLGRKRLSDWFGHRRHALKLKRLGSTPSLPTARASPPTYSHSRSTSPSSDARPHSPRRRAHSSASSHASPYPPVLHSYHSQPEPRTSGLSSLASWGPPINHPEDRPHSYYHEDHRPSPPISHTSGIPFPSASKHNYSLDSYASRRDTTSQPSVPPSSASSLQAVRSRPSLEWACAIERQRVRPYPKKPASREAGWSRHGNPGIAGNRSRSHSYSAANGPLGGPREEEDGGGSETEPEEDDVHEVLTPPQSLLALERRALVQSFGSAISASSSTAKYSSETQADLDAAMILVGMGKS
ncbi:unnamed protein product [Rhizoctonia solani]|uniref:Homeobox domain-containing protein n=1 Tax=Rhizoctonia solani TaxID=456999 RepID=A0A8H3HMA1_9AGAM|nr:unnamed protein product [Rhizoctonia solani]